MGTLVVNRLKSLNIRIKIWRRSLKKCMLQSRLLHKYSVKIYAALYVFTVFEKIPALSESSQCRCSLAISVFLLSKIIFDEY